MSDTKNLFETDPEPCPECDNAPDDCECHLCTACWNHESECECGRDD